MEQLAQPENLQTAQTYIDFVKNNLEPLAEHLKVSVEWLWNILVMQARVEGIIYLLVCISMFITAFSLYIVFFKNIKKARFGDGYGGRETIYLNKKTGEETDWDGWYKNKKNYEVVKTASNKTNTAGYISLISGIAMGIMLLLSVTTTTTSVERIVTGLVNPEFRAIEKIVEYAKPAPQQSGTQSE